MSVIKKYTKLIGGKVCASHFIRPVVEFRASRTINIIYYHFVGKPAPHYQSFYRGCTLERFRNDLTVLNRVFAFISLDEALGPHSASKSRRPSIAVTFDDGFDLISSGVAEILAEFGIVATTFVVTSCIDNRHLMWRHKLSAIEALSEPTLCVNSYNALASSYGFVPISVKAEMMVKSRNWPNKHKDLISDELWNLCSLGPVNQYLTERMPYFTWDSLRRWVALGHSVGFHTHTHPFCSRLEAIELEDELLKPAMLLRDQLKLPTLSFSYPFGHRLQAKYERQLLDSGAFTAFFGINGFSPVGAGQFLERAGVEQGGVNWEVFARSVIGIGSTISKHSP